MVPVEAQEGEAQGGQDQDGGGQKALQLALAALFQLFIGGDDAGLRLVDLVQGGAGVGPGGVLIGPDDVGVRAVQVSAFVQDPGQADQGPGRLYRGQLVAVRADGVMLHFVLPVSLFPVGLGDPVVHDGLVLEREALVGETPFHQLPGPLRVPVFDFDVGVDRVIVQHVFREQRPAAPLVQQLLRAESGRQLRVLGRQGHAVVDGVEGLVASCQLDGGLDRHRIDRLDRFQRGLVHAGNQVALGQVQGGVQAELRIVRLRGNIFLQVRVQESGIHVVLEISVKDRVAETIAGPGIPRMPELDFQIRQVRLMRLADAFLPG